MHFRVKFRAANSTSLNRSGYTCQTSFKSMTFISNKERKGLFEKKSPYTMFLKNLILIYIIAYK